LNKRQQGLVITAGICYF